MRQPHSPYSAVCVIKSYVLRDASRNDPSSDTTTARWSGETIVVTVRSVCIRREHVKGIQLPELHAFDGPTRT